MGRTGSKHGRWILSEVLKRAAMGRSQWPRDLRRGSAAARLMELRVRIPRGHGCLSLVNVVCYQVEVSALGRSPVQGSRTECGVCVCVSLSVIRNNNPLRLQWVGRRGQNKNERWTNIRNNRVEKSRECVWKTVYVNSKLECHNLICRQRRIAFVILQLSRTGLNGRRGRSSYASFEIFAAV